MLSLRQKVLRSFQKRQQSVEIDLLRRFRYIVARLKFNKGSFLISRVLYFVMLVLVLGFGFYHFTGDQNVVTKTAAVTAQKTKEVANKTEAKAEELAEVATEKIEELETKTQELTDEVSSKASAILNEIDHKSKKAAADLKSELERAEREIDEELKNLKNI